MRLVTRRQLLRATAASLGLLPLIPLSQASADADQDAAAPFVNLFDDSAGAWRPTDMVSAPQRRTGHSAVWTGRDMVVWGGRDRESLDDGAVYDLARDQWISISGDGSPSPRFGHSAVWTGREMLVWGGRTTTDQDRPVAGGGRYDPSTDRWKSISETDAPQPRHHFDAVWSGSELLVWGSVWGYPGGGQGYAHLYSDGARYDPFTDRWRPLPPIDLFGNVITTRALWIGDGLLVYGGRSGGPDVAAIYDPSKDRWTVLRPSPAFHQAGGDSASSGAGRLAVWTDTEVIGWGGIGGKPFPETGGFRYTPATQEWSILLADGQPSSRVYHCVIWTGREMLVWGGGWIGRGTQTATGGARFDSIDGRWHPITDVYEPTPRVQHSAIWTGHEMIVWGGHNQWSAGSNGGIYAPPA